MTAEGVIGLIAGFAAGSMALIGWPLGRRCCQLRVPKLATWLTPAVRARRSSEPERWKHLRVDQRMLRGLQVVPGQHPGERGTAGLK
jgi:hypothetical protein